MSGISSGVGAFSGINSGQLIEQLLALESRPKQLAQARVLQLQQQQAGVLDINTRLAALRSAAQLFRNDRSFQRMTAESGNKDVLTATAQPGAAAGSYQFLVDRLVSTQQSLSRGFADRSSTALGLSQITVESELGRLDRDTALADFNNGAGVERGRITLTDSAGRAATVDLSRAATVGDVLDAINGNGTAQVTASVRNGRLVVRDNAGGTISIANATGFNTATSLGIAGSATGQITGQDVYRLGTNTTLASLNDGTGVSIRSVAGVDAFNFTLVVNRGSGPVNVRVNIGELYENQTVNGVTSLRLKEGAVSTMGGVMARINKALEDAGMADVKAEIAPDGRRLQIRDTTNTATTISVTEGSDTTARDLGLTGQTSASGVLAGKRIFAGMNSVLARGLSGGNGVFGDGTLNITTRDGNAFSVTLSQDASVEEMMQAIQNAGGTLAGGASRLTVSLNSKGTGLQIKDNSSGSGNLTITGTDGADTAVGLGLSTGASGTTSDTVSGVNMQLRYLGRATLLSSLNGGRGVGTGSIEITDSVGTTRTVSIGDNIRTLGQLIDQINSSSPTTLARLNSTGDGIEIVENVPQLPGGVAGDRKLKIADASGAVARSLNLAGEASGTGSSNKIDGTYERTVTFAPGDTLQQVADKLNAAGVGVSASIINDGAGSNPFRLSLTARATGRDGRVIIDAGAFDLGLRTLDRGENSRVFFGSSDPARAVLLSTSSNTLDNVVTGVKIDLRGTGPNPVTLAVAADSSRIEKDVNDFVKAFNDLVDRIGAQTRFVQGAQRQAALIGDGTMLGLRSALYATVQGKNLGVGGRYDELADVGISVGEGGRLKVDAQALRSALATDPAAVEALFTARTLDPENGTIRRGTERFSSLSVVNQIEELAKSYVDSTDGVLTFKTRGLEEQIRGQNSRINAFDTRLERRRETLTRQFAQMEQAIAQLQRQQSAISSIGR